MVGGTELYERALLEEALHRELAVEDGDHDVGVLRLQGAVHNQDIAVVQPGALHRIAGQADVERGGRVLNQQLVEVEVAVQVIVGGRGESGRDQCEKQRSRQG